MFKNLIFSKSENFFLQMIRYSFAGGVAFVVDFSILVTLTEWVGLNYLLSAIIGFTVGIVTVYLISTYWVFPVRTIKNRHKEFVVFSIIGIVGLCFNELFLWLFTEYARMYYMISKLLATGLVYFWNFLARKYILFNKHL